MKPALLSIVIANYNYGRFLEQAILSVLDQACQDVELIVVDGGSTDNSLEIIHRYQDRLGWWCSEKDQGQSDAFNKGFSHATGRFLTWLNSDDVLFEGSLERLKRMILRHPACEWFVGGCFWLDPQMHVIKCSGARHFSRLRATRGEISVWAPSSFFTKALLERVGGVDAGFHYMMDTELWFRFYRQAGVVYRPISGYCWGLRLHPDAKMSGHNFRESAHSQPSHPKWARMRKEGDVFRSRYGSSRSTRITRWLSAPPLVILKNLYDTWRFKGKHYKHCVRAKRFS